MCPLNGVGVLGLSTVLPGGGALTLPKENT